MANLLTNTRVAKNATTTSTRARGLVKDARQETSGTTLNGKRKKMSRYINIDDIALRKTVSVGGLSAKALWRRIQEAPSIDVVRCGDCKFKSLYDEGDTKYYYCALEDRPNRQWSVDDTDFCSWGERKEGE